MVSPIGPNALELVRWAIRKLREWLEDAEEESTQAALEAHAERMAAIRRHERWAASRARRRAERKERSLILDDLSSIQARARRSIASIDHMLAEAEKVRGERLQDWIRERRARQLPRDDVEALRVEFRKTEALLCREEYRRQRLYDLITECSGLKHELTRRSLHFRDASRVSEWLPDEEVYRAVPIDLPKRFDLVHGEARPIAAGLYFALPVGLKGHLDDAEPAPRALRRGSSRILHVLRVDYRRATATVSLAAGRVLHAVERDSRAVFHGRVVVVEPPGARILVDGRIRAFLPRSRWRAEPRPGQALDVRFAEIDRYLDSPIVTPATDAA